MIDEIYSIGKFAKLVGKSVRTLQRWGKEGICLRIELLRVEDSTR